jgi:AcrR family transcriptional regulator
METADCSQTKLAILNAAERLFAAQGFRAASLRTLTTEARVNLGAVNYHFSTKDELVLAVLRRRIQPLNQERIALLTRFEKEAGGRPVALAKILEALFRPALELIAGRTRSGRYFVRLLAQCLAEPDNYLQPLIHEEFAERNRRFHAAFARALPDLSSDEVHWRLHFAQGVFLHTVANAHVLELSSKGRCRLSSVECVLDRVIAFCAAGLEAHPAKTEGKKWKS